MFRFGTELFPILLALTGLGLEAQSLTFLIDSIGSPSNDPSAASTSFQDIRGVAADFAGNVYISDSARHRIVRISPTGAVRTVAGTGNPGFSGDNGPAESAQLNLPYGIAVDMQGVLYIADLGNARVRRVGTDGTIRTIAGGGTAAPAAGLFATSLLLKAPRNVAADAVGTVYFSDFQDHRVLRVASDGRVAIVAGSGAAGPVTEGPAVAATLNFPAGLYVDSSGGVYIADSANHAVRRAAGGVISTVRVLLGEQNINLPIGVSGDTSGTLYIATAGFDTVVRVTPGGAPTVMASGGARDVNVSPAGVLHYATATQARRFTAAGQWNTVTGGAAVSQFQLSAPEDLDLEASGTLLVADGAGHRIQRLSPAGVSTLVAGLGEAGFSGDNGQAAAARLNGPRGVASDRSGNVYISDTGNHRIRRVDSAGVIRTVAGTGVAGNTLDSRAALEARLNAPSGIAADRNGEVYFSDTANHTIRRLSASGLLFPLAGNGTAGFRGDNAISSQAQLSSPQGLALDSSSGLLIADSGNHRIRRISAQGFITTVAGNGTAGFGGDGRPATEASLNAPSGVTVDAAGNIYIADTGNQRVRRVGVDGVIATVAGSGAKGFAGDQGPALAASLDTPVAVEASATGSLYLADKGNQRVRQLTLSPGSGGSGDASGFRVLHAATLEAGVVAPGMLLVLRGTGIGPVTPVWSRVSAGTPLDTALGDLQVRFDGTPVPLLYAQENMIHLQAPYRISTAASTLIEVVRSGVVLAQATVAVAPTSPGIFATTGGSGTAAAVNEDSTINGEFSGAIRGTAFQFFVTGEGAVTPAIAEGRLADAPYPSPAQPVAVRIGQVQAELISAKTAVTAPGLLQVVVRVPVTAETGRQALQVTVGSSPAQSNVTIFVR